MFESKSTSNYVQSNFKVEIRFGTNQAWEMLVFSYENNSQSNGWMPLDTISAWK